MALILYVVSVAWLALGVCIILYTEDTRGMLRGLLKQADLRLVAVLPLIFGLLLVAAAPASVYPWFVRLLGILGLLKAAFFFADPEGLVTRLNAWFLERLSDRTYRLLGIVVVILAMFFA